LPVAATLRACTAPAEVSGRVMNVATGSRVTLNETLRILERLAARPAQPRYEPPRTGDILHSQADIELARKLLGYEPSVNFEEGLRRTWEWYLSEYTTSQQRLAGS
jgi:nucleoside-diphosphate-sugar epimerase